MLYVFDFSTPANTAVAAPQKTVLIMEAGTITAAEIVFPPGPSHLLQLRITDALHQLWPVNPDACFAGDNDRIEVTEDYDLTEPPHELYAYTANLDDTFEHTVIIRITLKPKVVKTERPSPIAEEEEEIVVPEELE